jgi:hypothetical protein
LQILWNKFHIRCAYFSPNCTWSLNYSVLVLLLQSFVLHMWEPSCDNGSTCSILFCIYIYTHAFEAAVFLPAGLPAFKMFCSLCSTQQVSCNASMQQRLDSHSLHSEEILARCILKLAASVTLLFFGALPLTLG